MMKQHRKVGLTGMVNNMKRVGIGVVLVAVGIVIGVYLSNQNGDLPTVSKTAEAAGGVVKSPRRMQASQWHGWIVASMKTDWRVVYPPLSDADGAR